MNFTYLKKNVKLQKKKEKTVGKCTFTVHVP